MLVLQLWDLEANKKIADCSGHLSWVQLVQFSTDGSQLLSCSDDQTVRVSLCLTLSASALFSKFTHGLKLHLTYIKGLLIKCYM